MTSEGERQERIDFNTIKGRVAYRAAFPEALAGLTEDQERHVINAVHSGVLEGWEPTAEQVAKLAAVARGSVPRPR